MCVCYSHFKTSQSQRRAQPRNYIQEMAQNFRAKFAGHCTAKHSKDRDPAPGSTSDGELLSERASVRFPTQRRAEQCENVVLNTSATASSAARGLRSELQRNRSGAARACFPTVCWVVGWEGRRVAGCERSEGEYLLPPGRRVAGRGGLR